MTGWIGEWMEGWTDERMDGSIDSENITDAHTFGETDSRPPVPVAGFCFSRLETCSACQCSACSPQQNKDKPTTFPNYTFN